MAHSDDVRDEVSDEVSAIGSIQDYPQRLRPKRGHELQDQATDSGPSKTVKLMTSVFATCGPCRCPRGAKKNAPVE